MNKLIDLTGKRFGRLIIIERSFPNNKRNKAMWLCKCDCGNEKTVLGNSLRAGKTKSCGCLQRESAKKPIGISNMRQKMSVYSHMASKRGLCWNLTEEQFKEITQQNCYYCGAKPSNLANNPESNGKYIYNGIDRVDNTKGYIIGNVVPCCKICNLAKRDLSLQEFYAWIEKAYNYQRRDY